MNSPMELSNRMLQQNTLCCCGLDPDVSKFPSEILEKNCLDEEKAYMFISEVINVTAPYVCAFKAQKAFFDFFAGGHNLLKEVIRYSHRMFPEIPVIVDCKIGDTENTMDAYLKNLFVNLEADGVVVNPYMGDDVLQPFADIPEKLVAVLVRTSNSGASIIQDMITASGKSLWQVVLDHVVNRWNKANNMVPVISSTAQLDLQLVRSVMPDDMNILFAGIGEQGGDERGVRSLLNSEGRGVFVNSSRGILYAPHRKSQRWQYAVANAAMRLRDTLNEYRRM